MRKRYRPCIGKRCFCAFAVALLDFNANLRESVIVGLPDHQNATVERAIDYARPRFAEKPGWEGSRTVLLECAASATRDDFESLIFDDPRDMVDLNEEIERLVDSKVVDIVRWLGSPERARATTPLFSGGN